MQYHKKEVGRTISFIKSFAFLASAFFIGTLCAIKVAFGEEFIGWREFFAFAGLVLLLTVIGGIPISGFIFWLLESLLGTNDNDLYLIAWGDGVKDHPALENRTNPKIKLEI